MLTPAEDDLCPPPAGTDWESDCKPAACPEHETEKYAAKNKVVAVRLGVRLIVFIYEDRILREQLIVENLKLAET